MSFITFLLCGHNSPRLENLQYDSQLRKIGVTPWRDDRENIDISQEEFLKEPNHARLVLCNERTSSITLNFSHLFKAEEIWKRFLTLSVLTRNTFSLLTLGCLGRIYWKHIPGQSIFTTFNLIAVVAAAVLASIARLAHIRKTGLFSSGQFHFPSAEKASQTVTSQITSFRMGMLDQSFSETNNFIQTLDPQLRSRAQDFFTEKEFICFFTQVFSVENSQLNFIALYNFYVDRKLKADSPEARFVNAYTEFRSSIDFEKIKPLASALYSSWVRMTIEPSINKALSSLQNEQDQKFIDLYNKSFKEEMKRFFKPKDQEYDNAFKEVCTKIISLRSNLQEATDYITDQALNDFKKHLYTSGFKVHFRHVLTRMDEELFDNDIAPKVWLQKLFNTISDETIKRTLLESLDINDLTKEGLLKKMEQYFMERYLRLDSNFISNEWDPDLFKSSEESVKTESQDNVSSNSQETNSLDSDEF